MEKDTVKTAEMIRESELLKEAAELKQALADGKLVDVEGLDVRKIVTTLNDIKKQNAYLFDAIRSLNPHDKNFESKKNNLFGIANQLRHSTESQLRQLTEFVAGIKDSRDDARYMQTIASVNKPNKESVKYGQSFMGLRKSFLDRAVKRASTKTSGFDSTEEDDSSRKQS